MPESWDFNYATKLANLWLTGNDEYSTAQLVELFGKDLLVLNIYTVLQNMGSSSSPSQRLSIAVEEFRNKPPEVQQQERSSAKEKADLLIREIMDALPGSLQ